NAGVSRRAGEESAAQQRVEHHRHRHAEERSRDVPPEPARGQRAVADEIGQRFERVDEAAERARAQNEQEQLHFERDVRMPEPEHVQRHPRLGEVTTSAFDPMVPLTTSTIIGPWLRTAWVLSGALSRLELTKILGTSLRLNRTIDSAVKFCP